MTMKKTKDKTANTAKVGDSYKRIKYEVQTMSDNGSWTVWGRFDSLERAQEMFQTHLAHLDSMRWLIDTGHTPNVRFVEAIATCKVVA
jgi:hypothetical protein